MIASWVFVEEIKISKVADFVISPLISGLFERGWARVVESLSVEDYFIQLEKGLLVSFLGLLGLEGFEELMFITVGEVKNEWGTILKLY